jgi:two-component system, NtrC family, response regulator AtoC
MESQLSSEPELVASCNGLWGVISQFANHQRDAAILTCSMLCEGCAAMPPDSRPSASIITQHGLSSLALPGIIGRSQGLHEVVRITHQVAPSRACVLIVGETGTGKELIARAIHDLSPRCTGPYIRVNCGALTESLLESELFGHVKGSFTGAVDNRTGRFEAAHTGSIFLDEVNSTSPKLQVKLLRVLQEGEFERVGDNNTKKVDTRIIAATNCDLLDEIACNRFREDLYYRLNVVPIYLPPLRERRDDIEPLVLFFLKRYSEPNRREMCTVHPDAMRLLREHDWPGNVRELQNYVERAVILGTGVELCVEHLPPQLRGQATPRPIRARSLGADPTALCSELVRQGITSAGSNASDLHERIVGQVERELIQQVLQSCDRIQIKAAARLGINRNTLHKKLAEYRLDETDADIADVGAATSTRRGSNGANNDLEPNEH